MQASPSAVLRSSTRSRSQPSRRAKAATASRAIFSYPSSLGNERSINGFDVVSCDVVIINILSFEVNDHANLVAATWRSGEFHLVHQLANQPDAPAALIR